MATQHEAPDKLAAAAAEEERGKENESVERYCAECRRPLSESPQLINVAGRPHHRWHPHCFRCSICRQPMDKSASCHIYKDKIVCRNDYLKLQRDNSTKCARCRWPIGASDWVRKAGEYVYHLACFNCDLCLRQLNTGDQFTINVQERGLVRLLCRLHFAIESPQPPGSSELVASSYTAAGARSSPPTGPAHFRHHHRPSEAVAAAACPRTAAGASSFSSYVDDNRHHNHQRPTTTTTTTNQNNGEQQIYVSHSNSKLKAQRELERQPASQPMAATSQPLASHSASSASSASSSSSSNSSSTTTTNNKLDEYECAPVMSSALVAAGAASKMGDHLSLIMGQSNGQQQEQAAPVHQPGQYDALQRVQSSSNSSSNGSISSNVNLMGQSSSSSASLASKSKRVRTTFTEDQLSILQTHFQIDSNPDGQDLERIATITGLSKRVTQVWFQNSRARQKKYMIKRKPGACQSSSGAAAGAINGLVTSCSSATNTTNQAQHQQQQRHHSQAALFGAQKSAESHFSTMAQHKWPNVSDRSDLASLESGALMEEEEEEEEEEEGEEDEEEDEDDDDSRSSDNERLIVSDESNERLDD